MDFAAIISSFKELGPAVAAIIAMGLICYIFMKVMVSLFNKVLNMHEATLSAFNNQSENLRSIEKTVEANTQMTKATGDLMQGVADCLKQSLTQKPL